MNDLAREMKAVLARWRRSGESRREFGQRERISYHKLIYWRRKLDASKSSGKGIAESEPDLVPVRVIPEADGDARFIVQVGAGVEIAVPAGFDAAELARLVRCLRSC